MTELRSILARFATLLATKMLGPAAWLPFVGKRPNRVEWLETQFAMARLQNPGRDLWAI
jgi:hypothetical protein